MVKMFLKDVKQHAHPWTVVDIFQLVCREFVHHDALWSDLLHNIETRDPYVACQDGIATRRLQQMMDQAGSGALALAKFLDVNFVQEVIACKNAIYEYAKGVDVCIELGGEDAKIIYFDHTIEQRMNGTCAGGTGSFLDQMAVLLNTTTEGLNEYAKKGETIYPIASRCGVFAKTDIQPLLNEGAKKEDIALSIMQAVVNQTISGLACGKPIKGNVIFLGGPLTYLPTLKERFVKTLDLKDEEIYAPENANLFVAIGSALDKEPKKEFTNKELAMLCEITEDGVFYHIKKNESRRSHPPNWS